MIKMSSDKETKTGEKAKKAIKVAKSSVGKMVSNTNIALKVASLAKNAASKANNFSKRMIHKATNGAFKNIRRNQWRAIR